LWNGKELPPPLSLKDVDVVIHLAGENVASKRWTLARKQKLRESRIDSLKSIHRAVDLIHGKIPLFISASAIGIYGDRGDQELTEASPPGQGFLADLCKEWEAVAEAFPAERRLIFRLGIVLSDRGGFISQVLPMVQRFGANALGNGRQHVSWIHLEDLVEIIAGSIQASHRRGIYNAVSPLPIRNSDLMNRIAAGVSAPTMPKVPALALKALFGELASALLSSQRVVPSRLLSEGFQWKYSDIDVALNSILHDVGKGEIKLVLETWVPATIQEVWPFFSAETNLERLTPPFVNFRVLSKSTPDIQQGTCIDYQLRIRGVPLGWRSQIERWRVGESFSDNQLKGPYARWHHLHEFERLGEGTLLKDTIHLKPPLGWLGRLVSMPFVLSDVSKIFAYRTGVIAEVFARPVAKAHLGEASP
jgi:uncharacterized protein (TIGR01777 family)